MKKESMKYYKLIGKIQNAVTKSDNFDGAIKAGLHIILEQCDVDCAVMWYKTPSQEVLKPYYWICPMDLTSIYYGVGEGVVGSVFKTGETAFFPDFLSEPDLRTKQEFDEIEISSMVCVPFACGGKNIGCLQFLKTSENGMFSEEDAEVCGILTLFTEMAMDDMELPEERKSKEKIITVKDIHKSYQSGEVTTHVLKGVNFDVFEGEFLCFLGESGCGKSTMLNIIGGMDNADSGSFSFRGRNLSNASQKELTQYRREHIGFIFQSYNLMPNINVRQNLELIGELVEHPMDSMEALRLVGLDKKKDNYPSQLSGGQQQRVSIARALIKRPELILADEPTAALDYATSIEVLTTLEEVIASGTTLVMVTHNEEITRMADRVIRFRNGRTYEITVNHHPAKAKELVW